MATTSELKVGIFLRFNNELFAVEEVQHRTPGNLRAFFQVKMRNVNNGRILENRFRSGETIDMVRVERKNFQFLYHDGQSYHFMDQSNYEQIPVEDSLLGDGAKFLKENTLVEIMFDGLNPIGVQLPFNVDLKVIETPPGVKGDTATGATKPATLETGAVVNVPLFISIGEIIKVDTRTGEYLERAK